QRQPSAPEPRRPQGRRSSGVERFLRHPADRPLPGRSPVGRSRSGEAACEPCLSRARLSTGPAIAGEAAELPRSWRRPDLLHLVALDQVAGLVTVEIVQLDAALEARADLVGIILEALERGDLALVHQ